MNTPISEEDYNRIAAEIHSDTSPVGIDAKKTHILILHQLQQLSDRLGKLEDAMEKLDSAK